MSPGFYASALSGSRLISLMSANTAPLDRTPRTLLVPINIAGQPLASD